MIKFLNKFFKSNQKNFKEKVNFQELASQKEIQELFKSFNSFSKESELRFVGGCVRKLIIGEKIDDLIAFDRDKFVDSII